MKVTVRSSSETARRVAEVLRDLGVTPVDGDDPASVEAGAGEADLILLEIRRGDPPSTYEQVRNSGIPVCLIVDMDTAEWSRLADLGACGYLPANASPSFWHEYLANMVQRLDQCRPTMPGLSRE